MIMILIILIIYLLGNTQMTVDLSAMPPKALRRELCPFLLVAIDDEPTPTPAGMCKVYD